MRMDNLEFDIIMDIAGEEPVDKEIARKVAKKTMLLCALYPEDANDGSSRWYLWTYALNDGKVDRELYDQAEKLYGNVWEVMR